MSETSLAIVTAVGRRAKTAKNEIVNNVNKRLTKLRFSKSPDSRKAFKNPANPSSDKEIPERFSSFLVNVTLVKVTPFGRREAVPRVCSAQPTFVAIFL